MVEVGYGFVRVFAIGCQWLVVDGELLFVVGER
jgi:hypothetical protein